jgi:hypothetical protein
MDDYSRIAEWERETGNIADDFRRRERRWDSIDRDFSMVPF